MPGVVGGAELSGEVGDRAVDEALVDVAVAGAGRVDVFEEEDEAVTFLGDPREVRLGNAGMDLGRVGGIEDHFLGVEAGPSGEPEPAPCRAPTDLTGCGQLDRRRLRMIVGVAVVLQRQSVGGRHHPVADRRRCERRDVGGVTGRAELRGQPYRLDVVDGERHGQAVVAAVPGVDEVHACTSCSWAINARTS
ncbi:MAG: hypothetical protein ABIR68_18310 [Ilumatobacteraceae bacterium]